MTSPSHNPFELLSAAEKVKDLVSHMHRAAGQIQLLSENPGLKGTPFAESRIREWKEHLTDARKAIRRLREGGELTGVDMGRTRISGPGGGGGAGAPSGGGGSPAPAQGGTITQSASSRPGQPSALGRLLERARHVARGAFTPFGALLLGLGLVAATGYVINRQNEPFYQSLGSGERDPGPLLAQVGTEPPPEGTRQGDCVRGVALQHGLTWTESGWRSPTNDPEPLASVDANGDPWSSRQGYEAAYDAWLTRIETLSATAASEISAQCGGPVRGVEPPDSRDVSIVVLDNVSGGTLWIGWLPDLEGKRACDFSGGGLCIDPEPGQSGSPDVEYHAVAGPYPDVLVAEAAYCEALAERPETDRALTGGAKAEVFGGSYWTDYMPICR